MPDEKCHPLIQLFNVPLQVTRSHLNKQTNKKTQKPTTLKTTVVKVDSGWCTYGPHILWPDDVWSKHRGQIDGGHLVKVLIAGGVMQQVK